jgi:hypothetical protein
VGDVQRRFYVDEDASEDVVPGLRNLGYDVTSTRELGHKGWKDPRQLAFAARDQRTLVTCNAQDFVMLHEAWLLWSQEWDVRQANGHAGILIIPNGSEASIDQMIEVIHEMAQRRVVLSNTLFRWRDVTGWKAIEPNLAPF